jgi:hypothetical protein
LGHFYIFRKKTVTLLEIEAAAWQACFSTSPSNPVKNANGSAKVTCMEGSRDLYRKGAVLIFLYQKSLLGCIFGGLGMKKAGTLYVHLCDIWNFLLSHGIF